MFVSGCKLSAEALELRVVKFRYVVEHYLSLFGDVSSAPCLEKSVCSLLGIFLANL